MHQISLDDMRLVNHIAKVRSFSRAADTLGLTRPSVTRRIKQLEAHLGVILFQRSTRQLSLTPAGESFLKHSLAIETEWQKASEQMKITTNEPSGKLRISSLGLFNSTIAGPALSQFVRQYPRIELELDSTWRAPDSTKYDYDLMFNVMSLDDKNFINEPFAVNHRDFYASPDYLSRVKMPQTPLDLADHDLVQLNYTDLDNSFWHWLDGENVRLLPVHSNLKTDEADTAMKMTLLGHGICWLPDFFCHKYVENHQLVRLFHGRYATPDTLWAIYPKTPYENQRARLFIDMARSSGLLGSLPTGGCDC